MIKDPKTDLFIKFVYEVVSAIWLLVMPIILFILNRWNYNFFLGGVIGCVATSIALFGISWNTIKKLYKDEKKDINNQGCLK